MISSMRETSGHSRLDLFRLFVAGQHQLFDGLGGPKTKLTESFHRFWKIKVPAQRRLQQDGQRARYFDMPRFGLSPAGSLIDQKNVGMELKSEADGLAFSSS